MIKQTIYLMLCLLVGTSLLGCSKTEKVTYDETKSNWNNETLDENVVANFQAELIDTSYIYKAKYKALEVQKMKDIFFENDTSKVEIEKYLYSQEYEEFGYIEYLHSATGTEITTAFDGVHGYTKEYPYYTNFFSADMNDSIYNEKTKRDNLGTDEELSFLTKNDMEKDIREKIEQLDIDFEIGEIYIRTLSSEYLNQIQEKAIQEQAEIEEDEKTYDSSLIRDWKEEDGAYYVVIESVKDGVPLNGTVFVECSNGTMISPYRMNCIINKDGIQYVDFSYVEITEKEECDLISADHAVKSLKEDITSVIVTDKYLIENAVLCSTIVMEMGTTEVSLKPVWMFDVSTEEIEKSNDERSSFVEYYLVDAVTGEVLH